MADKLKPIPINSASQVITSEFSVGLWAIPYVCGGPLLRVVSLLQYAGSAYLHLFESQVSVTMVFEGVHAMRTGRAGIHTHVVESSYVV